MASYDETSDALLRNVIQPRRNDSHKGDNGAVCVVGGSRIFHGAPYFASMAALRTGADMVYLAVPKLIASAIRALSPDLIVFPIADAKLTRGAADALLKWLPEIDSLVIGPGLGRQSPDGLKKIIGDVCLERKIRASLDAELNTPSFIHLSRGKIASLLLILENSKGSLGRIQDCRWKRRSHLQRKRLPNAGLQ